jgi:PAS domain S-box-containing protein
MLAIITLILLNQFLRLRTQSMLVLASGFFFKAVVVLMHLLSYPGFILSNGLEGGLNVSAWFDVIWHCGFPAFVAAYVYLHAQTPRRLVQMSPPAAILLAIAGIVLFAIILYSGFMRWGDLLPIVASSNSIDFFSHGVGLMMLLANMAVLLVLWVRANNVLSLWLSVSLWAVSCNIIMLSIEDRRFEFSYYLSWFFELCSVSIILAALIKEMSQLYTSLFAIMEEQQLSNAAEYRSVIDTAIDAIIVIDEQGKIQSFNKAAETMFGYSLDEVLDQNVKMLMPEPYSSAHDQYLSNYRTTGVRKVIGIGREVQGKRKNGTLFPLELAVAEWNSSDGRRFTGVLRDLSERKRIEQQLLQSQKMEAIGQLTGGMAHDFNNILGVVIGNLDMLAEQYPEDKKPIELHDALESANAGADLVRRLLAFARRQPLLPKPMRIDESVEGLLPLVRRIIGDQVLIDTNYDPDLLPVLADPTQFENALLNLIINARDAMPMGGTLHIACRSTIIDRELSEQYEVPVGQYSTLVVRDSGMGIPADILPHVVEPFYTTKPPGTGSGLGLSMVFGYARQSGGVLRIYSEIGRGTEVRVYLPSIVDVVLDDSNEQTSIDLQKLHGNERILMVEDTLMARTMVYRMLISLGYTVRVASDATEAMLIIDSGEKFDLLFTDIVMPGKMDGIALARMVRERYPHIKVLFTSGFTSRPTDDISVLTASYITKPYRKVELAKVLRALLSEKHNGRG